MRAHFDNAYAVNVEALHEVVYQFLEVVVAKIATISCPYRRREEEKTDKSAKERYAVFSETKAALLIKWSRLPPVSFSVASAVPLLYFSIDK